MYLIVARLAGQASDQRPNAGDEWANVRHKLIIRIVSRMAEK